MNVLGLEGCVLAGGDGVWSHPCDESFLIPVNYVMLPHLYLMSDCGGVIVRSPVSERHPSMEPCFGPQNTAVGAGLSAAAYCCRDVITVLDDSHEKVGRQTASHFSPPPPLLLWLFSK